MKTLEELFQIASDVRKNAYAPYSNFFVGSCIETTTGKIFAGCNVENAAYSVAVCSEGNSVGAMIAAGERKIKRIVIVTEGPGASAPCGACRQRIFEFSVPETTIHLFDLHGEHKQYDINTLLPHAFGPADLAND